jgi:hypothetical protein
MVRVALPFERAACCCPLGSDSWGDRGFVVLSRRRTTFYGPRDNPAIAALAILRLSLSGGHPVGLGLGAFT